MEDNASTGRPVFPHASRGRTVLAGAIGNVLEWYDFGLFGYFASVIGAEFFPGEDRMASLLDTFGVFATGFLMRPIGGLLFGLVGDRLGRKRRWKSRSSSWRSPRRCWGCCPAMRRSGWPRRSCSRCCECCRG